MKHTSFRIKPELLEALQIRAKAEQRSVNQLINMILQHSLDVPHSAPQVHHNVPQVEAQVNTSKKDSAPPTKAANNPSAVKEQNSPAKSAVNKETIAEQVKRIADEKRAKQNTMPSQLVKQATEPALQIDSSALDDFDSF